MVDRAKGYGYEGSSVDGTDLAQCLEVINAAVRRARAGRPPQLVVAATLRLAGHGEHDDASYVSDDIRREPFAQDALQRTEQFILEHELLDREGLQQIRAELAVEVARRTGLNLSSIPVAATGTSGRPVQMHAQ